MKIVNCYFLFLLLFVGYIPYSIAQKAGTTGDEMVESINIREDLRKESVFNKYPVRNVGPVVQGGRISDIAVNTEKTKQYLVAYASGGIFKTNNNGISFEPIFDNQGALTIGDIAIAPSDPDIIWVGTGEKNSSRSSYAGSGIYKSDDGGKTWQYKGLPGTQHIGRIIIHPTDPDKIWIAAMGNLYTHNQDRGVYMTTDGGDKWEKVLYVNDSTGAIDLVANPENPDMIWAAFWERTRKAWDFKGHGSGSAIYKSMDGGKNWKKTMQGIADPEFAGRIGLDLSLSSPNIIYALIDNQFEIKEELKKEGDELIAADFVNMTNENFQTLDNQKIDDFLKENDFPEKYSAKVIKKEIQDGKYQPIALAEYLGNANNALFNTKVKGAEVYRSDDYGETWNKTHDYPLEGVYYTYGYYFGEIRVNPSNPDNIYVFGVPLIKSMDGGKTFARTDTIGDVHSDHQSMWINPNDSEHMILGNDGGLYISYDAGAAWKHINNVSAGQFYTVNVDMEKPYNIYGGLQDNGILRGSSRSIPNETEHWEFLFGGDGMFAVPDPRDHNLVYVGYQFGNYYRIHTETGQRDYITPRSEIGEDNLRFNWRTPVIMSSHNPDILYMGAQKLFRTLNKATNWTPISGDLTKNLPNGNVPYSTITCIAESTLKFGLLYVGTDDGNVQVSKDGGNTWTLITKGLPENKWVSSIYPSVHKEGSVYLSLTGYRDDDFSTYVYASDDYGSNWTAINGDIKNEGVNVIIEDPVEEKLLFLGTDYGTYLSIDKGKSWQLLSPLPNVANYDMIVHPRDNDLVVATHGRSIYVLPVEPLRKLVDNGSYKGFMVFEPDNVRWSKRWGESRTSFSKPYLPKAEIMLYLNSEAGDKNIRFEVTKDNVKLVEKVITDAVKGFNFYNWDVRINTLKKNGKRNEDEWVFAEKGTYDLSFTNGAETKTVKIEIK